MPQNKATILYIDNNGALMMANAQQPTRRTRHMDIKKFIIQDWVQGDLLLLQRITSSNNYSNSLTKTMTKDLHYRHNDYLLGKTTPLYAKHVQKR